MKLLGKKDVKELKTIEDYDCALKKIDNDIKIKNRERRLNSWSLKNEINGNSSELSFWGLFAALPSTILGAVATEFVCTDFNFFDLDIARWYLTNHPEALAYAQEQLGTTDLNYIAGYVLGDDGLAQAVYSSTGLADFFMDLTTHSIANGFIAGALGFMLPFLAVVAKKLYCESKRMVLSSEIKRLKQEKNRVEQRKEKLNMKGDC